MKSSPQVIAVAIVGLSVAVAAIIQSMPRVAGGSKLRSEKSTQSKEFRVLSQSICEGDQPCIIDGRRDYGTRAFYIVEEPNWTMRLMGGGPILFYLVGKNGIKLPLMPMMSPQRHSMLILPRGYGRAPRDPSIQAIRGGVVIGKIAVSQPPDERRLLVAPTKADSRVRLLRRPPGGPMPNPDMLQVLLSRKLGPLDKCVIGVRQTTYRRASQEMPFLTVTFITGNPPESTLWLPNGEASDVAELNVRTIRVQPMSERVTLKGARLEVIGNKPIFRVDTPVEAKTRGGFRVILPAQPNSPVRPLKNLTLIAGIALQCSPMRPPYTPAQIEGPMFFNYRYRLVSPRPSELGLKYISCGATAEPPEVPKGPIKVGPVDLVVEVTYNKVSPVDSFDAVVPIEAARENAASRTGANIR